MKVSELADMLEDLADEYEDMVTDEVEDKFESRYDEAKAEIERRIAAVYGESIWRHGTDTRLWKRLSIA